MDKSSDKLPWSQMFRKSFLKRSLPCLKNCLDCVIMISLVRSSIFPAPAPRADPSSWSRVAVASCRFWSILKTSNTRANVRIFPSQNFLRGIVDRSTSLCIAGRMGCIITWLRLFTDGLARPCPMPRPSALSRRRDAGQMASQSTKDCFNPTVGHAYARVPDQSRTKGGSSSRAFALFLSISRSPHTWSADSRIRRRSETSGHLYHPYRTIRGRMWRSRQILSTRCFTKLSCRMHGLGGLFAVDRTRRDRPRHASGSWRPTRQRQAH